ncbi:hypothetical protein PISL3812_08861 [Talaromyces islandicus]|uniref:Beta-lactamase-related domain-containing protein n=1 Tax=Talaromyces islandicus TaxID=28573 RepID=A0A0U1M898_TALIS|nr:hypothetical protein PISL3812_08861 [Talaromyces islandicus]
MMYTVASYLVEVKSERDFGTFLEERFFKPLDMSSTGLQPSSAQSRGFGTRMATGYCWNKADSTYRGLENPDCPEGQGAGSIITSVNDFIKWVKALINREGPITQKVYEGLTRMRAFINPNATRRKRYTSPVAYAAGLDIYYYRGHMVAGHNGVFSGWGGRFFFLPDFEFGSVIIGNSEGGNSVASILARRLIDNFLGVEEETAHHNKPKSKSPIPNTQSKSKVNYAVKKNQEHHKSKENGQKPQYSPPQPPKIPLSAYIGSYWNPGYHGLVVQIRDDMLFVDATDRSMGFTLTFEHVLNGTQYNAHLSDRLDGGDDLVKAEFLIENGRVIKLGLHLEMELKEMIWFEKEVSC